MNNVALLFSGINEEAQLRGAYKWTGKSVSKQATQQR